MDDDFELEDESIEEIKSSIKGILNTLPKSMEFSLVPMYYKFNEDLETNLDPLSNEDERFYNICLNTGNMSWMKGFQTAIKYCSVTFGLKLKNETPVIIPITMINNISPPSDDIAPDIDFSLKIDKKPNSGLSRLPIFIMDWQAFILGIFSASCVWFLLALFGLLG